MTDLLTRINFSVDTDAVNDLLPYNWVDTNARQTMFEMNRIATAA